MAGNTNTPDNNTPDANADIAKRLEQLETQNADLQKEVKGLQEAPAGNDALNKRVEQLESENKDLKNQIKKIVASPEEPEATKPPTIPEKSFTVDGRQFRFTKAQFYAPGHGKMTAEEAMTQKDVQVDLVKRKSGVIREVFEEK